MSHDLITLQEVQVRYHVGVPDAERARAQSLRITVRMGLATRRAAQSGDLRHTVDYHQVYRRLLAFGRKRRWKLIETLAEDIATMILMEFGVKTVAVEVRKFILPKARWVSICISRGRKR